MSLALPNTFGMQVNIVIMIIMLPPIMKPWIIKTFFFWNRFSCFFVFSLRLPASGNGALQTLLLGRTEAEKQYQFSHLIRPVISLKFPSWKKLNAVNISPFLLCFGAQGCYFGAALTPAWLIFLLFLTSSPAWCTNQNCNTGRCYMTLTSSHKRLPPIFFPNLRCF